jgi:hypothetical protein
MRQVHTIDIDGTPVDVVEYLSKPVKGSDEEPRILFHPYIDGKDSHHSYQSMAEALLGVIAYVNLGLNHDPLVEGVARALGVPSALAVYQRPSAD